MRLVCDCMRSQTVFCGSVCPYVPEIKITGVKQAGGLIFVADAW
jgi:hypothetical protein